MPLKIEKKKEKRKKTVRRRSDPPRPPPGKEPLEKDPHLAPSVVATTWPRAAIRLTCVVAAQRLRGAVCLTLVATDRRPLMSSPHARHCRLAWPPSRPRSRRLTRDRQPGSADGEVPEPSLRGEDAGAQERRGRGTEGGRGLGGRRARGSS